MDSRLSDTNPNRDALPCLSPDPMQMILATPRDKSPDQPQLEFACRALKIVRPWILDQFPVKLSLSTVRRVLRRLGLTPQRPQFRSYQQNTDAVRTWIEETYPALAQHAQEQGALLLLADEAGMTSHYHRGTTWGAPGPDARRPANGGAVPAAQAVREQPLGGNLFHDPCRNRHRSHV